MLIFRQREFGAYPATWGKEAIKNWKRDSSLANRLLTDVYAPARYVNEDGRRFVLRDRNGTPYFIKADELKTVGEDRYLDKRTGEWKKKIPYDLSKISKNHGNYDFEDRILDRLDSLRELRKHRLRISKTNDPLLDPDRYKNVHEKLKERTKKKRNGE